MKKRIYLKESQLARIMSEGLLDDSMYARENHFKNQETPKTNRLKTEFEGSNTINMSYDEDSNRLYISVRNAYDTGNNAKEYVYDGNTDTWENGRMFTPKNPKVGNKLSKIMALMHGKSIV